MFNCCSHGTLLHFSPQGSHLSICYYHQDQHQWQLHTISRKVLQRYHCGPPTHWGLQLSICTQRLSIGFTQRYSAIHFQGWLLRQVSCYTLLSGFRLPWPPSCCLKQPTPFLGSHERFASGTLSQRLVHPTSPVLLTKNGPLGTYSYTLLYST